MTNEEEKDRREQKEDAYNLPLSKSDSQIGHDGKTQQESSEIECQKEETNIKRKIVFEEPVVLNEGRFEKRNFIIQTGLALIGLFTLIGFVIFSIIQHGDSEKALRSAKQSSDTAYATTQTSLALAESANKTARQSLELSTRNFVTQNRPWIGIRSCNLDTFLVGNKIHISVTYQNYGHTPALKLGSRIIIEVHTVPNYNLFDYGNTPVRLGVSALSPTESGLLLISSAVVLSSDEYHKVINNAWYIYVFGKIIYTDVFDGKDTTTFCYIYDADARYFRVCDYYGGMK